MAPTAFSAIIIGAGMSGILAAKKLHDGGIHDFLILEATPRIGGRIQKTEFGGQTIELGANWIHGGEAFLVNPLHEAVEKIQLNLRCSKFKNVESLVYKQEGGLYEAHEVEAAMTAAEDIQVMGVELADGNKKSVFIEDSSSEDMSPQEMRIEDMSIYDMQQLYNWNPSTPLERLIDYFFHDYEDGEPPHASNLKRSLPRLEFDDYGDDQYLVADPRGYESLVHHYATHFLSYTSELITDPRIMLNKVVNEICYTNDGVIVKTEDGSIYQAKAAIVSVSLGVLKSNLINFKPKLPEWKEQAISGFSMASFTKIFLKFPRVFWPTGYETEFFLYAHEKRGYYPVWKHCEEEMPGSKMLLVMTSGEESKRIEKQSEEITKSEAMQVLHKMFGVNIPEADDIIVTKWNANKFYNGSFSNWPPLYSEQLHAQLRGPVASVFFTGEHTSHDYFGCVEGAYNAGCATGEEVVKYLQQGARKI